MELALIEERDVILPVLRAFALAVVVRVSIFAVEVHLCILLDMAREVLRRSGPFDGARHECPLRELDRLVWW